jgi:hypothetical protein
MDEPIFASAHELATARYGFRREAYDQETTGERPRGTLPRQEDQQHGRAGGAWLRLSYGDVTDKA